VLLLAIGLGPVVWIGLMAFFWLRSNVPDRLYWQTSIIFLIALEIAYAVTVALTVTGIFGLGVVLLRERKRKWIRPAVTRGLLLCTSVLCALAAAEAVCAVWLQRSHRGPNLPLGGVQGEAALRALSRFPKLGSRIELPTKFLDTPDDPDIDVVVLGESSAAGVPYSRWISIGTIVAWQLDQVFPGRTVRLASFARPGETLQRQHEALSNVVRRPELLVIYCGHNEIFSRLSWTANLDHYVADHDLTRWQSLVAQFERLSPFCALIRATADKCRIALPPPPDVTRDLIDVPVYTTAEYEAIVQDFRRRLDEMVTYAETVGTLAVLIVPPANDAGFEPNRSFLPATTTREERDAFRSAFLAARRLEESDPGESMKKYRALVARAPCFAETHYRLAWLLEQSGAWEEAYEHYSAARDLDGFPMRCLSALQQAYRDVASRHGCVLIDGQSYFHTIGRHGLLDDQMFQDAMHPSLRGQIALAQAVLQVLHKRRAFGWPAHADAPTLDPAGCARHFGMDRDAWRALCAWSEWFNNVTASSRYDSSRRASASAIARVAAGQIAAGAAPESVGLANIGIPPAVPVVPLSSISPANASD
jgi:hypothetical protein